MKKNIAILLIIFGIVLICYPKLRLIYLDFKQQKILQEWQKTLVILDETEIVTEKSDLHVINIREMEIGAEKEDNMSSGISSDVEGILKIEKIDLEMPILKGATRENLNISVASLEGTSKPGQPGNYCIAGHRGRSRGRLFNRLDELEKKDIIQVLQQDMAYIYEVDQKLVVKPEDVRVLLPEGDKKLITLVTCDYSTKPYQRLIVRGRLIKEEFLK